MNPPLAEKPLGIARGVIVVGSTTVDRNEIETERFVKLGGVTTYAGLAYRRLGVATWVATRMAPADTPLLAFLKKEGVSLLVEDSPATTHFVNRVADGRRTQEMPAAAGPVRARHVRKALANADCVHLGPLHPRDLDPLVFPLLKKSRTLVVLDAQGYVRRVTRGRVIPAVSTQLGPALAAADIVKTNRAELETILRFHNRPLRQIIADYGICEWLVTNGPEGGFITDRLGAEHRYGAVPAPRGGDPTGAGDVFLAAYIAARFASRLPVAAACDSAARLAAEHLAGRFILHSELDLSGFIQIP